MAINRVSSSDNIIIQPFQDVEKRNDEEEKEYLNEVRGVSAAPSINEVNSIEAKRICSQMIRTMVGDQPFVVKAEQVENIKRLTGATTEDLLEELAAVAKPLARPPISNYFVSVAAIGESGNMYVGVNLEFPGVPLTQTVHGEQFMTTIARNNGETKIVMMKIFAAPCGFCRQFLSEIGEAASEMEIVVPNMSLSKFSSLLPEAFGPQHLGLKGGLLTHTSELSLVMPESAKENPLVEAAVAAANDSYAPYSKAPSGVAILLKDDSIYTGSYLENAAFNPSLSPLQTALVALVADNKTYNEIIKVVLVESEGAIVGHKGITRDILESIAPNAEFIRIVAERST